MGAAQHLPGSRGLLLLLPRNPTHLQLPLGTPAVPCWGQLLPGRGSIFTEENGEQFSLGSVTICICPGGALDSCPLLPSHSGSRDPAQLGPWSLGSRILCGQTQGPWIRICHEPLHPCICWTRRSSSPPSTPQKPPRGCAVLCLRLWLSPGLEASGLATQQLGLSLHPYTSSRLPGDQNHKQYVEAEVLTGQAWLPVCGSQRQRAVQTGTARARRHPGHVHTWPRMALPTAWHT